MTKTTFGLHFGALAPSIAKQLKAQKLQFDPQAIKSMQAYADAISLLRVHSILTEPEGNKARDRVYTKVQKHLKTFKTSTND